MSSNKTAPAPTSALRGMTPPVRAAVPPLVPVLIPLVITAIALSVLFARLFPGDGTRVAPQLRFTEVTEQAGLAFAPWRADDDSPTTLGNGVAVLDFDNDGLPDLFFVTGSNWPWEEALAKRTSRGSLALFRNMGDGTFRDVTAIAGLNVELQGMAAAAGDFDNDGFTDLYVTCIGTNHLFRNRGYGRFEDVTEHAGVGSADNTWSTGAAWIDVNGDAHLDLVVAHYARWPVEVGLSQAFLIADVGRSYGAPTGFVSTFPTVYRNKGDGSFEPLADSAGLREIDPATGLPVQWPLAVVPVDANGDDRLDLLITYHTAPQTLFVNEGGVFAKSTFGSGDRPEGASAGLASASGQTFATSSGVDERSQAIRSAVDLNPPHGEDAPVDLAAKLGVAVADLDLGGHFEIFSGQGHAERAVNKFDTGRNFKVKPALYWNDGQKWRAVSSDGDTGWSGATATRGVAIADFDRDGDGDIVITQSSGPPRLLRNDQRLGQPWLRVRLDAGGRPVDGTRVEVHTPRRILLQTMAPAMGLFAQSESALTFGLGEDSRVRRIVVRWADGMRQELEPEGLNRTILISKP